MSASSISRLLAAEGYRPLPSGTSHMREGCRVSGNGLGVVYVRVDWDDQAAAARRAAVLATILVGRGYAVANVSPTILRVEKGTPA